MATKPSFTPTAADLQRFQSLIERSERRFHAWRVEYRMYEALYSNSDGAWNEVAPGGGAGNYGVRDGATTVVRNTVGLNVLTDIRRLSVKDAKFSAVPLVSTIQRDTEAGPVTVEGTTAAYAQSEIITYGFKMIGFEDTLPLILENAKIANEGWRKIVSASGPDAPATAVWVGAEEDGDVEMDLDGAATSRKKIKPHSPCNSLATGPFPGIIWCDVEDIVTDPDAITKDQINVIFHRILASLSDMKTMREDDPDGEIDPLTGNIKRVPKYRNLDKVEPNFQNYRNMTSDRAKQGDIRNDRRLQTNETGPMDGLVYYEAHIRLPADSEAVMKGDGGEIPKTIDGFCYYILSFVEGGEGENGPTMIRWQKYPEDLGGFALDCWKPRQKAGSQKGFSDIRNYYESNALENYFMSWLVHYHAKMKPEKIVDSTGIDPKSLEALQRGGMWDSIMYTPVGGKTARDCIYITEYHDPPASVFSVITQMRQIGMESSGRSPNQLGQYSGGEHSATETEVVQQTTSDQIAFEMESLKRFIDKTAHQWFRLFKSTLPANGRFEIPGSNGGFVTLDRMQLDLECAYSMEYTSFPQSLDPIETKQLQDFMTMVMQTPPQLWPVMRPWWKLMSTRFSPAAMSTFKEFEKIAFASEKKSWDPDIEHLAMREGIPVQPADDEDFTQTIPAHEKMLQQITSSPEWQGWNVPLPSGAVPVKLLIQHIALSKKVAEAKGFGPALGLTGGAAARQKGSGAKAGRTSQDAEGMPNPGEVMSGAANLGMQNMGIGSGGGY